MACQCSSLAPRRRHFGPASLPPWVSSFFVYIRNGWPISQQTLDDGRKSCVAEALMRSVNVTLCRLRTDWQLVVKSEFVQTKRFVVKKKTVSTSSNNVRFLLGWTVSRWPGVPVSYLSNRLGYCQLGGLELGKPYWRGRLSTVDLLVLTSLEQLILI